MKDRELHTDQDAREVKQNGEVGNTDPDQNFQNERNEIRERASDRSEFMGVSMNVSTSNLLKNGCYFRVHHNTYNDIASPRRFLISGHGASAPSCEIEMGNKGCEKRNSEFSWWIVVLGLSMVAILLTGCLRRGLFHSTDLYPVILMTGVVVLFSLVMYVRGVLKRENDGLASVRAETIRLRVGDLVHVGFPLAIMVCYAVHAWAGSVSTQGSILEMLRWSLLAMFALLAVLLAASKDGMRWLAFGWQLAGGVLVLSGILAVCGVLPLPYGVMRTADPEISSAGARLGGLLQYPNAYGAVVGMYALERLTAAAGVLAGRAVPARRLFAAVLPLMPAQAALLLSESRGAWLAAGCAAAAAFLQRRGARLPLLLALAAPLACAAWLYRQLADAQLAPAPVPGLLALAGAWAAALLGTLLLCRLWHSGGPAGRASALAATVLACIAAALMAAASTAERFAAGVGTGASRLQLWRDALRLWTEAAWLGHGGDTWRNMFRAIQSSPYVGGEVHSGLLDLALDTGLLGSALIAGWMLFTLRSIRRFAPRLLPPVLVFVLHGIVDFDWSYALSWMLFIWLAAWAVALRKEAEPVSSHHHRPGHIKRYAVVLMLTCWLGGTVWITARYSGADMQYRHALTEPMGTTASVQYLRSAYRLNPYRPDLAISLARTLPQAEAKLILLNSLSHSPSNPDLYVELGRLEAKSGEGKQAGVYFISAIARNRYDVIPQRTALYWMEQATMREISEGKVRQAQKTAAIGIEIYERYKELASQVNTERMRNDRRFQLHPSSSLTAENLHRIAAGCFSPQVLNRRTRMLSPACSNFSTDGNHQKHV
ncbi:O-antigen ligase family protein [Paenibacillus amylolyticus]|uniref:O-antigen ligase family protein n=1 Tax=Paenibacillus amylolyticus TaxID=1451 RepID=A0A5M9WWP6_PAEAM|nr:O-antigen ligase family protein [Paenibacillus amylolyticus]KAA8786097.1 O-antigen ligase family protein [Paenibacillus amylolyticus]